MITLTDEQHEFFKKSIQRSLDRIAELEQEVASQHIQIRWYERFRADMRHFVGVER